MKDFNYSYIFTQKETAMSAVSSFADYSAFFFIASKHSLQ